MHVFRKTCLSVCPVIHRSRCILCIKRKFWADWKRIQIIFCLVDFDAEITLRSTITFIKNKKLRRRWSTRINGFNCSKRLSKWSWPTHYTDELRRMAHPPGELLAYSRAWKTYDEPIHASMCRSSDSAFPTPWSTSLTWSYSKLLAPKTSIHSQFRWNSSSNNNRGSLSYNSSLILCRNGSW